MAGPRLGPHKTKEEHEEEPAQQLQLPILKSPIVHSEKSYTSVTTAPDLEGAGYGIRDPDHDCPELERHEEATIAELFFDLFFAANLSVFSEVHDVTNVPKLVSYIGYFCLLWMTWALVGLYDVRFITDSLFERLTRAAHLGVFIGFAVVGPNFNPDSDAPDQKTLRTFSLMLMISRLVLTLQYLSMIWHTRKYRQTKGPLAALAGVHLIAAIIYLGITFAFTGSPNLAYVAWYVISVLELSVNLGMSFYWRILSFQHTHLLNRMHLLTLIILGEGVIVACKNVGFVVANSASWTSADIGVLAAAIASIYLLFQIYFDGLGHVKPGPVSQLFWAFLHFPFHLCLTLLVEGACQFFTFFKIVEVANITFDSISNSFNTPPDNLNTTVKDWFVGTVNQTLQDFFADYPATLEQTVLDSQDVIKQFSDLPSSFYDAVANNTISDTDPNLVAAGNSINEMLNLIANSLFETFHLGSLTEVLEESTSTDGAELESEAYNETLNRFSTVFAYTFATAGIVLVIMQILFIASRAHNWNVFNIIRITFLFLLGIGVSLVALLLTNYNNEWTFLNTPWILPTLTLAFLVTLILVHIRHPPPIFHKHDHGAIRRTASY